MQINNRSIVHVKPILVGEIYSFEIFFFNNIISQSLYKWIDEFYIDIAIRSIVILFYRSSIFLVEWILKLSLIISGYLINGYALGRVHIYNLSPVLIKKCRKLYGLTVQNNIYL